MKKLFFLFGLFIVILTSCSDERDFGDTPFYQMPLNQEDSLVMVKIYKALGCESWSDKNKIDLKKRDKWPGCTLEYNEESREFRVVGIYLYIPWKFSEYKESVYYIPDEISKLAALKSLGFESDGTTKFANLAAVINCPSLEYLKITHGDFTEKDIEELSNLPVTLTELLILNSNLSGSLEWTQRLSKLKLLSLSSNKYEGKVPGIFKQSDYRIYLDYNNFNEMDWTYFTDNDVKNVPILRENRLHGIIPQEVLDSPNWLSFRSCIAAQQDGYSFINWNGLP